MLTTELVTVCVGNVLCGVIVSDGFVGPCGFVVTGGVILSVIFVVNLACVTCVVADVVVFSDGFVVNLA